MSPRSALYRLSIVLPALLPFGCGEPAPEIALDPARPPIVLITLDTTRSDRLGCYGYALPTSPQLDRLCEDATRYDSAYSTTSWTLPAHASLFTGEYTYSHGVRYDTDGPLVLSDAIDHRSATRYRARGLDADKPTLASRLSEAGYATAGFVAGPWMKRVFGLASGFDHWDDEGIDEENGRRADALTDAAIAWLRSHTRAPFLLFLNYYDAHSPYSPPDGWRDRFADQIASGRPLPEPGEPMTLEQANAFYDAEIAFADHHLGRLLDALRDLGLYAPAWIIVTADHGDVIGEHGTAGHGRYLWEEEIRIPLVIKRPGGGQGVDAAPIQLTDIAPMLLEGLGLPSLPRAGGPRVRGDDAVLAELYPLPLMFAKGDWRALVVGRHKLMWNSRGRHKLHDLGAPAGEDEDRAKFAVSRTDSLLERLEELTGVLPPPRTSAASAGTGDEIDDATRRALEGLGYLETERDASEDHGQEVPSTP
ncbi:MAG: sulfatase [Myxococcota bacterium]|nr:sulfatase [Myxococcota bacterium]